MRQQTFMIRPSIIPTELPPAEGALPTPVIVGTVTAVVTYRDEVMDTAVTLTLMNAVALTHDANAGTAHASALIRAKAGTAILAKITNSAQTTTKLGGVIERVN